MTQQLYKPAEACKIAEVAPYVLRYWETEFPALSEGKEKGAPRYYSERDVRIISRIRELLYDEGFTVAGAKKRLDGEIAQGRFDEGLKTAPPPAQQRGGDKAGSVAAAKAPAAVAPAAVSEAAESVFLSEAAPPKAAAAGKASAAAPDSSERKRVIRELKDIVKLLDHGRKK
jgi:DNA-binding transcriptional MerR regulator